MKNYPKLFKNPIKKSIHPYPPLINFNLKNKKAQQANFGPICEARFACLSSQNLPNRLHNFRRKLCPFKIIIIKIKNLKK